MIILLSIPLNIIFILKKTKRAISTLILSYFHSDFLYEKKKIDGKLLYLFLFTVLMF